MIRLWNKKRETSQNIGIKQEPIRLWKQPIERAEEKLLSFGKSLKEKMETPTGKLTLATLKTGREMFKHYMREGAIKREMEEQMIRESPLHEYESIMRDPGKKLSWEALKYLPEEMIDIGKKTMNYMAEAVGLNRLVIPVYKKTKKGQNFLQAYKETWEEVDLADKMEEIRVQNRVKEAEKAGASRWEISKIASESPMAQKLAYGAFFWSGGINFTTKVMARDAIKKQATAILKKYKITDKASYYKSLHKYHPDKIKLTGLTEQQATKISSQITTAWQIKGTSPTIFKKTTMDGLKSLWEKMAKTDITGKAVVPYGTKPPTQKPAFLLRGKPKTTFKMTPAEKLKLVGKEPATKEQIIQAHKIAKEKLMISDLGKVKPQYRRLAKGITGKASMLEMTQKEAGEFINSLKKISEPKYVKGKLVPPSIPKTTKVVSKDFFRMKFKEPNILKLLTPQTYYSQILGVKPLVEPLELAKQRFDLTYRDMANGTDKMIKVIDKIGKTTLKERTSAGIKNQPTRAVREMRDLLDRYEKAPADLSPEKKEIFNWFRDLNKKTLEAENEVRVKLDLEPIKYRKAYVRHIADTMAQEMLAGKYPFPQGLKYWAGKIVGKKIFNPMEFHRQLSNDLEELWTRDLAHATKSMLWTALKEINLSQPLKLFNEQLGAISKDPSVYKRLTPEEKDIYDLQQ